MLSLEPSVVRADSVAPGTSTAAVNIVPADGKPRGIRLRAQNVSTVITQDGAGVWADTDLEVQLQNRGKSPVVLPIGIPGPQATAFITASLDLPQVIDSSLGKQPLSLTPVAGDGRPGVRASAVITLPVAATLVLHLRYRQAVPVNEALSGYVYPLTAGNVWAGAPESLGVTLTFKPPLAGEQIMYATAGAREPRPGVFQWTWNGVKAPANVAVAFVTNAWWQALNADRAAISGPGAGLSQYNAVTERYWHLATLAPPAFAPHASFYERDAPHALAALRAGIAAASSGTAQETAPADLARARERLAGLYLAEGSRQGGDAAGTYLQLAVDELAAAVALDPGNAELGASATALQERLAQAATSRGDGATAAAHLARLRAIAAGQAAPSVEQQTQQNAVTLAESAVASGDLADARRLLTEAFGPQVLEVSGSRPPAITQALLYVRSRPDGRQLSLQLVDDDQGRSAGEMIGATAEAMRGLAPVTSSGSALTVTLAYTDPAALVAAQGRLAAALPKQPELALLVSALTTRRLAWPEEAGLVARTSRYEERVDLSRAMSTWESQARTLETAADEAERSDEPLGRLQSALWRADARAWRDLGALSRATYQVELREQGAGPEWLQARVHLFYREGNVGREWVVRAGETRQLEAAVLGWRYDRLALAAGAALMVTVLTLGLLWLVAR